MRCLAIVTLLAWVGCTEAASISADECGNLVLEAGEECDRPDDLCTADCRVRCEPGSSAVCAEADGVLALDQACCPQGFACGADSACRAPNGKFVSAGAGRPFISLPFGGEFRVGDLDGDHIDDALGVTSGTVIARYGSATSPLATAQQRSTPFPTGATSIGDLTGDRRPDIVIPTSGGLSILDSTSGVPEAVAIPAAFNPGLVGMRVAETGSSDVLQLLAFDGGVALSFERLLTPALSPGLRLPCESVLGTENALFSPAQIAGLRLHPFVDPVTPRIAVPLVITRPGKLPLLCIEFFRTDLGTDDPPIDPPIAVDLDDATFDYTPAMQGEVEFANLDPSTSCPELVIPVTRSNAPDEINLVLPGVPSARGCTITPNFLAKPPIPGGASLAAITLVAGTVALVTPTGVRSDGAVVPIIPATRQWTQVAVGDVDGNGLEDFAAIGPGDDVEVFEQQDSVAPDWRVSRIPTTNLLTDVVIGDFDGDRQDDVAFSSTNLLTTQIRVAFRDGAQFAPSRLVDTVVDHHQLAAGAIFDPALADPAFDQYDDLMTSHGGFTDATDGVSLDDVTKLTLQFGGANRELTAPWVPLDNGFGRVRFALATAVGPFSPDGKPGVIAGFFQPQFDDTDCDPNGLRVIVRARPASFGVANGLDRTGDDVPYCQLPSTPGATNTILPLEFSGFVPLTTDPDPPILMVSRFGEIPPGQCGALILPGRVPVPLLCAELFDPSDPSFALISKLMQLVVRVERIGDRDLVVSGFASTAPDTLRALVFRMTPELTATGLQISNLVDLSSQIETVLDNMVCQNATPIELGTRATDAKTFGEGRDLAFACQDLDDGLIHVLGRFEAADGELFVDDLGTLPTPLYAHLETGDLNGDGIPDLVAASISGDIHALLGCDSRGACP